MRKIAALFCCIVTLSAHAELTQSRAHGFHWYSVAPKEKEIKPTAPVNVAPTQARTPYEQLMEMKRQTLNTLSQALITPSYETTYDYMKIQQTYAKRNQAFVRYWQQVLMTHPELDHTLIFPTDNSAIAIRNDETSALMERVIHEGSKKYGLILFYQGRSSVSQKMAAHLAPFANASHFSIISVFLKNAEMTKQLKSTNDVIEAIKWEQEKSNEIRRSNKLDKIQTIFLGNLLFISDVWGVSPDRIPNTN